MFKAILNKPFPLLIHCLLGRDRSGFACAILGMLADASYEQIIDDFMQTYIDLHFFDKKRKPLQYSLYKNLIDAFLMILTNSDDIEKVKIADFNNAAKQYLLCGGMSEKEISDLCEKICN